MVKLYEIGYIGADADREKMVPSRMSFFLWGPTKGTCWSLRVAGDCINWLVERTNYIVGRWIYVCIFFWQLPVPSYSSK